MQREEEKNSSNTASGEIGRQARTLQRGLLWLLVGMIAGVGLVAVIVSVVGKNKPYRSSGRLMPVKVVPVISPEDGTLVEIIRREGEKTNASDSVFRLESRELSMSITDLENDCRRIEGEVSSARYDSLQRVVDARMDVARDSVALDHTKQKFRRKKQLLEVERDGSLADSDVRVLLITELGDIADMKFELDRSRMQLKRAVGPDYNLAKSRNSFVVCSDRLVEARLVENGLRVKAP